MDTENKSAGGVGYIKMNEEGRALEIANNLAADSYEINRKRIEDEADKVRQEMRILRNDAEVSDRTVNERIGLMEGELIGLGLANEMNCSIILLSIIFEIN